MAKEHQVLAAVMYAARFSPTQAAWPYWLLRRLVVPYVAARQFVVIERDGFPAAFAGWAWEHTDQAHPWRRDHYFPNARDIARGDDSPGSPCIVDFVSPFLAPGAVAEHVRQHLGLAAPVPWLEWSGDRRLLRGADATSS